MWVKRWGRSELSYCSSESKGIQKDGGEIQTPKSGHMNRKKAWEKKGESTYGHLKMGNEGGENSDTDETQVKHMRYSQEAEGKEEDGSL